MPLQGEAKREYQREYMRRKRAGLPTRIAEDATPWCDFCGKSASEVRVLVRAPTDAPYPAHICDECARLAAAV
jgi:hypothetical protein